MDTTMIEVDDSMSLKEVILKIFEAGLPIEATEPVAKMMGYSKGELMRAVLELATERLEASTDIPPTDAEVIKGALDTIAESIDNLKKDEGETKDTLFDAADAAKVFNEEEWETLADVHKSLLKAAKERNCDCGSCRCLRFMLEQMVKGAKLGFASEQAFQAGFGPKSIKNVRNGLKELKEDFIKHG